MKLSTTLKLQKNTKIIEYTDVIRAFTEKIQLWKEIERIGTFHRSRISMNTYLTRKNLQYDFKRKFLSQLDFFSGDMVHSFPDLTIANSWGH